jgi:hypothetical protein
MACEADGGRRQNDGRRGMAMREVLGGWATPSARDFKSNEGSESFHQARAEQTRGKPLSEQAHQLACWPTPLAAWPTPNAMEGGQTSRGGKRKDEMLMGGLVSGQLATGTHAQTEKRGQLSPDHSRWLMGYSAEHLSCAPTVMPSSRRRLNHS